VSSRMPPQSIQAAEIIKEIAQPPWESYRLKYLLATPITDGPHLTPEFIDEGFPFLSVDGIQDGELKFEDCRCISSEDHYEFRKKSAPRRDDILLGKAASTGKIARVKVDTEFSIWSPLALIRPDTGRVSSAFLEYCLKSTLLQSQIDDLCSSNTQKNISMGDIPRLVVPLPPSETQQRIANYLDRETARIDGLITEKERMLALLEEKRAALISRVVTRGLDPNVPLKPSGQEWLGEIPAHWEMSRLKYLGKTVLGLTFSPDDLVNDGEGVLVLRASNVKNRKIVLDDNIFVQTNIPHSLRTKPLDILICSRSGSRALIGKSALITDEMSDLTFGAFMTVFRSDLNRFLFWVFNSTLFDFQAGAFGTATINQLTTETLANMEVPVPPIEERDAIAEFLRQSSNHFDNAISAVSQSINLAKERRAALITAAVTGQIPLEEMTG